MTKAIRTGPGRESGASLEQGPTELDGIRILIVTDDDSQAREVHDALVRPGAEDFAIRRCSKLDEALWELGRRPAEVVLLDLVVGTADGGAPLRRFRAAAPDAAVIVLAGRAMEAEALECVHAGAQDYLVREHLESDVLMRAVRYARERHRMLTELERRMGALEASEASLRRIITTTADGIVVVGREGGIRFVNPAAERLFNRSADRLIGQPFGFPLVAGERTEIDIVTRNGESVVAEVRVTESEWDGEPARLVSLRDITERRRAEEHARELIREQAARAEAGERRASFLAECSSMLAESLDSRGSLHRVAELSVPFLADWCIIDVVEEDGRISREAVVQPSPARAGLARALLHAGPDTSRPCGVTEALRVGVLAVAEAVDDELLGSLARSESLRDRLRSVGFQQALLVPLRNRERTLGCMSLLSTGTRRWTSADRAMAEELARRIAVSLDNARLFEEAQMANRAKADFLAVVSHELRTPLNAVIGYADLLLLGVQGVLPASAREYIERIRNSGRHLLFLIEEILTFSRMEAGRENLRTQSVCMADIIREVAELTEPLAMEKGIEFTREPIADVSLFTDPGKVRQILINLLSNAVKFTDEGEVRLAVEVDEDSIACEVTDSGIGIRPDQLERIFEPFWQVEQSRTRRAEGTGLGLSVARRLARMLGGDIYVTSEPDKGSRFTLRLPRHSEQAAH